MKRPIQNIPGTIAYILDQHRDELFDLINQNKIAEARQKALSLIQDKSIKDKQAVIRATKAFTKPNNNLFLSSLMAYMTGMTVSQYTYKN